MNVLVIAAHPDDEILGCGGTMARHAHDGNNVHVMILAEGATSRAQQRDREQWREKLATLSSAADKANKIVGASSLEMYDFPDNRMDSCDLLDVVKVVEQGIEKYQPEIIYTHHRGDVNVDHQIIQQAVTTAVRPMPGSIVKTVLFFEVASSTEWQMPGAAPVFQPNWYVDISETLNQKLAALEAYNTEMRSWPHARSIKALEHLAHWRGANIGCDAAEAFILGKHIR